jgi:CII-binding regulator of phage lambda lysogenization HflD
MSRTQTQVVTLADLKQKQQNAPATRPGPSNSNPNPNSLLQEESEDTDTFYGNIFNQMKTVIETQNAELEDKTHKLNVVEKAIQLKNDDMKKKLDKAQDEIKKRELELKMLEQEATHYRTRESTKNEKRLDVRKLVKDIHELNLKKRERTINQAQLDEEAREYLKKFE